MDINLCPCGSDKTYQECCEPLHKNIAIATSAVQLMRSRYAAFVKKEVEYLYETTHSSQKKRNSKKDYANGIDDIIWVKLEIVAHDTNTVTFKAFYLDNHGKIACHHEKSNFKLEEGKWYYVDGKFYN